MKFYNWTLSLVLLGLLLALIWVVWVPPAASMAIRHRVPTAEWRTVARYGASGRQVDQRFAYRWSGR